MPIILALLIMTSAHSGLIKVNYGLFNYSLKYQDKEMVMTGDGLELSFRKNTCNEKLFTDFSRELITVTKRMNIQKMQDEAAVHIITDEKSTYAPKTSREGQYFLKLPEYFRKLKIREKIKCPTEQRKD